MYKYNPTIKITSFRVMGNRVDYTVNGRPYHTDREGEGIWEGEDYTHQIAGCLDFSLKQKTRSGVQRALERYYS